MKSLLSVLAGVFILAGNVNAGNDLPDLAVSGKKIPLHFERSVVAISPGAGGSLEDIGGTPKNAEVTTESEIWRFALAISKVSGYTKYEIGGTLLENGVSTELYFPISQLKFPLNFYTLGLRAERKIDRRHTFFVEASKNLSNNRGKMKDSDYLPGGITFIFSKSDAEIDAKMVDVGFSFLMVDSSSHSLSILLGYRLEDFDYKVKNLNQWQPLEPGVEHIRISGLVGTYDVTYHTPYISARLQLLSGEFFKVGLFLDYSPIIFVRDRDDHILRKILSKGKTDGNSYRMGINLFHSLGNGFFTNFRAYRSHAEADGTETSFIYEGADFGTTWEIDHKNESSVSVFSLLAGLSF